MLKPVNALTCIDTLQQTLGPSSSLLGSSENALTCGYATPASLLAENVFAGSEGPSLLAKTTVYQGF